MPALMLDNCCCCIELRTGCLIIGYLNLVCEIVFLVIGLMGVTAGAAVAAHSEDAMDRSAGINVFALSVVFLLVLLFSFAFTLVLLVGVHKNKRGHIKAYLIVAVICLILTIAMFFASFAGTVTSEDIVSKVISIALSIYFILVIRSYYYKMEDNKPAVYNTA